jgi:hypothetical protein
MTANFSIEILKAKWALNNVFQALKENNCQSRLLYSAKLSVTIEAEICKHLCTEHQQKIS